MSEAGISNLIDLTTPGHWLHCASQAGFRPNIDASEAMRTGKPGPLYRLNYRLRRRHSSNLNANEGCRDKYRRLSMGAQQQAGQSRETQPNLKPMQSGFMTGTDALNAASFQRSSCRNH
ncbi:hypothetical protein RDV64_02205 [Acuticoccus sp. MNP-M23]|uniref:hypothetical protein n=1 Tax=Acuticoccus sp. MNP-M23 TaxID=3072793 RepID=UPI002814E36E|nr:hypothetical protein [Acuticoccus sp. MNP-M23]WMS43236.1 hypothetical protein RDV64_02205 [Acuticoccus sp. MNP-M23]